MVRENIQEYSVSEISDSIKGTLENSFGYVKVRGEVSGLSKPASGHIYLNLKDDKAVIKAIIWRSAVARISFIPEDGLEVICSGKLTTGYSDRYPGRSDYSIIVDSITPAGEGALMALLEQRKKKLAAEGLFEEQYKKSLPKYPETIGIVTSPTGAVIKDILHRLNERFPCNVILWPVPVQGQDAAQLISDAVDGFNNLSSKDEVDLPDLIIIARGGGSIEDLWPFNEEIVIRSVFKSNIPIVSAIGHETDTTLIDFVSDLRAPTPTAAAEISTPDKEELLRDISEKNNRLNYSINLYLDNLKDNFISIKDKLPVSLKLFLNNLTSHFQNISQSLNFRVIGEQLKSSKVKLISLEESLLKAKNILVERLQKELDNKSTLLESLSYKSVLKRGYSVTRNSNKIIKSKKDLKDESELIIETNFATLKAKLREINDK
ncbi:exodeoxyribonuclease VII large subunit [Pelagibacterales bacterium SAG-MED32]|nr:exodeoxyribonuclease VII large subunit [Pelagibacterales bacterium SAG-MED32]